MPFGKTSKERLATCHSDLQCLFDEVDARGFECTIIEGHRPEDRQNALFAQGKSKVQWPEGKHNKLPSMAADVAPCVKGKISWNMKHCLFFAGAVLGIAAEMGIRIRWGGNWDMDDEVMTDQSFQDLVHFELAREA